MLSTRVFVLLLVTLLAARLARQSNNAQVITLGTNVVSTEIACAIVEA
ncbi:MAG: RpiB/LacA/LacB family sugar-phosphate isomerase [Armatimonadetes bacterium]|nr:RpiB/LacA/LacB family sugar-phosphate isomerase [Armatimonadota bacterium]